MSPKHALLALLLIGCVGAVTLAASAAPAYDLTASQSIDTPEQTVSIHGNTYTITSIATAAPDSSVTVDVTVPDDTSYAVDLYNDDEQVVVDPTLGTGSGTVSVTTEGVAPGTYALTLQADNDFRDVQPLVVEGYDVSLSAPTSVEAGTPLTVSVDATPTASSGDPAGGVEVAVWNGDTTRRVDAEPVDGEAYEATIEGLEPGEYEIYAAALGSGTVMGEPEVLGATGDRTVTVTNDAGGDDPPDDGGDDPPDEDDGDGTDDGGDGSGDGDSGTSDDADDGSGDGGTGAGSDGDTGESTDGTDDGDNESSGSETIDPTDPAADDGANGGSDDDPVPGFGLEALLVGALAGLALAIRRVD
ncbi:hypothetical protein [Halovivax limisalsi]|uniref:hypothetical protein n=1 Tax=Halovivax limisalsi TaxID=1453760 RepID=UPI001FFDDA94|nr:hypothetical protein [Halovivax limisalsi]